MAFLLDTLEQDDPDAGATAVVGISKLMLSGLITDEEVRSSFLCALSVSYLMSDGVDDGVMIDSKSIGATLFRFGNSGQPAPASMPLVLLPRLLLLLADQSASNEQSTSPLPFLAIRF